MAEKTKYLTEATLFSPAANKWASDTGILNNNGGLLVLKSSNNLSDIVDTVSARINLGVRIGADVQPYSERLTAYANGLTPSQFSLSALANANAADWRTFIGAGTVSSVTISGGTTGLLFLNGTTTTSGTSTLSGTLSVAHGGTGVTTLSALKSGLNINNVDNTSDANKPISTAVQLALESKFDKPIGSVSQYIRGDGSLAPFPTSSGGGGTVTSITVSGGSTGLTFSNGTITSAGTTTLSGTLSLTNGGTGVTTLAALKNLLSINNVNNTSDASKPISSATATALDRRVKIPASMAAGSTLELPTPEGGKVIGWNAQGTALINTTGGSGVQPGAANIETDIFDSDGSSRVYTLSIDPGSIDNVSVSVGGVIQTPLTDYTLSGSILTFTATPPLAEKIVIKCFNILVLDELEAGGITTEPFSGSTIPDGSSVQDALQLLETKAEVTTLNLNQKISGPSSLGALVLPEPEAGLLLGWNPAGNAIINIEAGNGVGDGSAISYVTIFEGDGVETEFTLGFSPRTLNDISVSVGGVDQPPGSAYTLSGSNTLVFTDPIPSGSKVIARYIRAVGVGETQADLVATTNFSGTIIPNDSTVQSALQALETALEAGVGGGVGGPSTIVSNLFVGNGSQTTYQLTENPQFQNNLFVEVGGISNVPVEDYVWDSVANTVTFTSAPPSGAPIVIRHIRALIIDPDRVGIPRLDKFTGDGVSSSFELEYEPTAFESIIVSITGVVQIPGESYTLEEPKTIVFSGVVANGLTISVQYNSSFTGYNVPTTSAYRNRFVGDGIETEFELSFNPGFIQNIDIVVGGVYQDPEDSYEFIAPNLIRFSQAPDDGSPILIKGSRVNTVDNNGSPSSPVVPRVTTFTGDGTTDSFELPFTVSSINSLSVTVGGIGLTPVEQYQISGKDLTLNIVPEINEKIVVRGFESLTTDVSVPHVDVFTSDGSQTTYQLSRNPGNINNLNVSAGGIALTPIVDYNWVGGTTFTLTEAVLLGEIIIIRYHTQIAVGSIEAVDVTTTNFSGVIIPNGANVQSALQSLETAIENIEVGEPIVPVARFDVFDGDGTTSDFELTYTPSGLETIEVFVGSVIQIPDDDYTLVGPKTILFDEPIADGIKVLIRYGNDLQHAPTVSVHKDTFTSNGSTTAYTLSFNPGSIDNLNVVIGGIVQAAVDDYTYTAPNTLTFIEAPPVDRKIVITGYRVTTIGETSADLVSTGSFTGNVIPNNSTVEGALQSINTAIIKLKISVNPMEFGAVGDGVADDGDAINDMFDHIRSLLAIDPYTAIDVTGSGRIYRTTKSLNFTGMGAWNTTVRNLYIIGACTGKAVFDLIGTRGYTFNGVGVWGDKSNRPAVAFQAQRGSPGGFCDNASFVECFTDGWFTRAAVHDYGQETTKWDHCTIYNRDHTARVVIHEGYSTHPMTSDYTSLMTGGTSFINKQFLNCDYRYLPSDENLAEITGLTNAVNAVVTATDHSFQVNEQIVFQYVVNMLPMATKIGTVLSRTANTFTVDVDTTGMGVFGGSGIAVRRATKSPFYMARCEGFSMPDCYIVSYGRPPIEIGFPDPSFQRMEQLSFTNFLFEGAGHTSEIAFNPTNVCQVLGFSLSTYNTHSFASLLENMNLSYPVSIYDCRISAVDPIFETPLTNSNAQFAMYNANITFSTLDGVGPDYMTIFNGDVLSLNDGKLTSYVSNYLALNGGRVRLTGGVSSGTGTPSFGNNKPGSSGDIASWQDIIIDGTTYCFPVWSKT